MVGRVMVWMRTLVLYCVPQVYNYKNVHVCVGVPCVTVFLHHRVLSKISQLSGADESKPCFMSATLCRCLLIPENTRMCDLVMFDVTLYA